MKLILRNKKMIKLFDNTYHARFQHPLIIILAFAFLFCIRTAQAEPWNRDRIVKSVETYFNQLTTLEASFRQTNPNSTVYEGIFYLKQPGKFRFTYKNPANYLIVSDGKTLVTYDADMDNPAYIPLSSLPVSVLFSGPLKLSQKTEILETNDLNNQVTLTLSPQEQNFSGYVTLVFHKKPFELKAWHIFTPDAGITEVQLFQIQRGIIFENEKELFKFQQNPF